jgi:hypothetical protein
MLETIAIVLLVLWLLGLVLFVVRLVSGRRVV